MKTENKSAVTEALEMIELNLKQFPNAFLALNGTWGECIKALEKQIPKKPTPHIVKVERLKIGNARWGKGTTVYKCPCCNNFISRLYDYCFNCGQAIDWSDEI